MPDSQHRTTHDDARERHDPVGGREHPAARRADVDAAMTCTVWRCGREVLPHDRVRRIDGPAPVGGGSRRGGTGDGRVGSGHGEQHEQAEQSGGEAVRHPTSLAALAPVDGCKGEPVRKVPPGTPAGERCYNFRSTRSNPGDYACPFNGRLFPPVAASELFTESVRECARAPGSTPTGAEEN